MLAELAVDDILPRMQLDRQGCSMSQDQFARIGPGRSIAWAILLIAQGVVAIRLPLVTLVGVVMILAWLIVISGSFQLVHAFDSRGADRVLSEPQRGRVMVDSPRWCRHANSQHPDLEALALKFGTGDRKVGWSQRDHDYEWSRLAGRRLRDRAKDRSNVIGKGMIDHG